MDVGGILAPSAVNASSLKQWNLGECFLVEVISKTGEGEGIIRIKGQDRFALIETSTQLGAKFWVKVANINGDSLLLIREPLIDKLTDSSVAPKQFQQLIERGVPIDPEISILLETFTQKDGLLGALKTNGTGTRTDEFVTNVKIPEWNELSEENGAEKLVESLRSLGLNYEQRIQQMLKLDSSAKEIEKNSLKDTLKFSLLQAIQKESQGLTDVEGPLTHLLQKLTGQQLWLKTGTLNNAYMLLQLPLLNQGQLVPVQIAIESARKGPKMDEEHCRIAIQIDTLELGEVGIDAFFDHKTLNFRVLTGEQDSLPQLIEEVMPATKAAFAKLGINLVKVETGDLVHNLEFQNFLKGLTRSGVDVQR